MSGRSVPDELVQAAADGVMEVWALFRNPRSGGTELVRSEYEEVVRSALQAAFAKLPECEAAVMDAHQRFYGSRPGDVFDYDQLRLVLAALAREFGNGETSRG